MSGSRRYVDRTFEVLVDVDDRLWPGIFFGGVGLYTLAVVFKSLGYSPDARLFPLVIGVPFLGLVVLQLALLLFEDRLDLESATIFDLEDRFDVVSTEDVEPAIRYRREFGMFVWLAGVTVLLWAVGFLPTLAAFLFSFVWYYERDLVRAAIVTAITYGFVYGFFIRLLGAPIYRGALAVGFSGLLP